MDLTSVVKPEANRVGIGTLVPSRYRMVLRCGVMERGEGGAMVRGLRFRRRSGNVGSFRELGAGRKMVWTLRFRRGWGTVGNFGEFGVVRSMGSICALERRGAGAATTRRRDASPDEDGGEIGFVSLEMV